MVARRKDSVMTNPRSTSSIRTVMLECEHRVLFKVLPLLGEEIFCKRCNEYREVIGTSANYRVQCEDCKYARNFGGNDDAAREYAYRHLEKRKDHTILVVNGLVIVERVAMADDRLPL